MAAAGQQERTTKRSPGDAELVVENLTVKYGKFTAVDDVSLVVPPASVTALLGLNGAGKSSLLRGLMGLVPSQGKVAVTGSWVNERAPHVRSHRGLALLPEGRGVFPSLTVEQNIIAGVHALAEKSAVLEEVFGIFPILSTRRTQTAGTMSGGEQQMLSLARCIASRPKVMLLDEVSLGLSPLMVQQVYAKIAELRSLGVAFLIVEQFAHAVLDIADGVHVMVRGRLLSQRSPEALAELSAEELGEILLTGSGSQDEARLKTVGLSRHVPHTFEAIGYRRDE